MLKYIFTLVLLVVSIHLCAEELSKEEKEYYEYIAKNGNPAAEDEIVNVLNGPVKLDLNKSSFNQENGILSARFRRVSPYINNSSVEAVALYKINESDCNNFTGVVTMTLLKVDGEDYNLEFNKKAEYKWSGNDNSSNTNSLAAVTLCVLAGYEPGKTRPF